MSYSIGLEKECIMMMISLKNVLEKYPTVEASYRDHSIFLQKERYAPLFELDILDYKGWAKGLKKAGYATNPRYPQLLIQIIEQ